RDPTALKGEVVPLSPGIYPVELLARDGTVIARQEGAVAAIEPGAISIHGVTPFEVATAGGTPVTFVGGGFEAGLVPRLGGLPLTQVEVLSQGLLRGLSPPLEEGKHAAS